MNIPKMIQTVLKVHNIIPFWCLKISFFFLKKRMEFQRDTDATVMRTVYATRWTAIQAADLDGGSSKI